jgi:hypothetical protein
MPRQRPPACGVTSPLPTLWGEPDLVHKLRQGTPLDQVGLHEAVIQRVGAHARSAKRLSLGSAVTSLRPIITLPSSRAASTASTAATDGSTATRWKRPTERGGDLPARQPDERGWRREPEGRRDRKHPPTPPAVAFAASRPWRAPKDSEWSDARPQPALTTSVSSRRRTRVAVTGQRVRYSTDPGHDRASGPVEFDT